MEDMYQTFMDAIDNDDLDAVKSLIAEGTDVNIQNECKHTALMHAAYHGQLDIVQYVVQQGADIHVQDDNGATALMYAVCQGHLKVVQYLVRLRADVGIQDKYNDTALDYAMYHNHRGIVKYLLECQMGRYTFVYTIDNWCRSVVGYWQRDIKCVLRTISSRIRQMAKKKLQRS